MPEPIWTYNPKTHNYHRNGKFVKFSTIRDIAMQTADASGDAVETLTRQMINGQLRLDHWQALMRNALRKEHSTQYMAGRGGKAQMTPRDYGILGAILKVQYGFLDDFAADIAEGKLTPAWILNRARMYVENAHQSFWRGRTEALGMPRLPTYPAYGDTQCLTKCRCRLAIRKVHKGWEVTWILDPTAREVHCNDCPDLASLWNPLFVPAGMDTAQAQAWYEVERERMLDAIAASAEEHAYCGEHGC